MKKILITGFEPFGGEAINPSWEAVKLLALPETDCRLKRICLPVVFGKAAEMAWDAALAFDADVILCVGQAGGRKSITPEQVGINLRNGTDNAGVGFCDASVIVDGPAAYFSTLPLREMVKAMQDAEIAGGISYSAGTYVCNDLLYLLLHKAELLKRGGGKEIKVGFVHLPYLPEQAKEGVPSMPLEKMVEGLQQMVCVLIS